MAFDSLTTTAVVDELQQTLAGGRVDKIIQPADLAVGVLLRAGGANHWLHLSAHPQHAWAGLSGARLSSEGAEPTSFIMLLRKYVEGQRLLAVTQMGHDRVILFAFPTATLVAEVMGRLSNVILIEPSGPTPSLVLGSLKRIGAEINRYRVVLTHHPYVPPPPPTRPDGQPRLDPATVSPADLHLALTTLPDARGLDKGLIAVLDGCSPQLAREAIARAGAAAPPSLADTAALAATLHDLVHPAQWQPCLVRERATGRLLDCAPYLARQYGERAEIEPMASMSMALEALFGQIASSAGEGVTASPRRELLAVIERVIERLQRKASALRAELPATDALQLLRLSGEMLLAYSSEIPAVATTWRLDDPPLTIDLDPTLTAIENAQAYFHRYTRARQALARVPEMIAQVEGDLEFAQQARVFADLATTPGDLTRVRADLRDAGLLQAAPLKKGQQARSKAIARDKSAPEKGVLRLRSSDGMDVLVGRSARQNEAVTFDLAGPHDVWLHARQIPGAHVIIRTGGRSPSPATLREAAQLAAGYSQGRAATSVPVDYTQVRLVRRIKGGKPGQVHYSGEATLVVHPRQTVAP